MTTSFEQPTEGWTLTKWRDAIGITLDELSAAGVRIAEKRWPTSTLQSWNDNGIPDETNAFWVAVALNHLAEERRANILAGHSFYDHLRLFLRSKACKYRFAMPTAQQMSQVFRTKAQLADLKDLDLYSQVFPRPPKYLFGRQQDKLRVLEGLQERAVSIIDGIGGDGKTALAWFSAKAAVQEKMVDNFDWTTDKRSTINIYGQPEPTGVEPLDFYHILLSMALRFGWSELLGRQENQLQNYCADRLSKGFYLIVVDNLETISDSDMVVRRLQEMLKRRGKTLTSRALVTSRVQVQQTDVWRINIRGIEAQDRVNYIRHVAPSMAINPRDLTNSQCDELAQGTDGNPLLIQIALARYAMAPGYKTFSAILDDLRQDPSNTYSTFYHLFEPLVSELPEPVIWLAIFAAVRAAIDYEDLREAWSQRFEYADITFIEALATLLRYRIIDPSAPEPGRYTMHSLVRAYLRSLANR
jgi:hypothetical protein